MTIKVKAPRAWWSDQVGVSFAEPPKSYGAKTVRIVRESDWKKLMKLLRCVEDFNENSDRTWDEIEEALDALRGKK